MRKFLIKVNGNQYEVEVEEVRVDGAPAPRAVETNYAPANTSFEKPAAKRNEPTVPGGASTVAAPMPGTILKISVKNGDIIKKGQVLLILEAMKMENEIVAPADGKVVSINVEIGASVSVGDILVTLA